MSFHRAQRSTQTVLSMERHLAAMALLRIEAYDKRIAIPTPLYENLLDPFALLPELQVDRVRCSPIARASMAQSSACAGSFPSYGAGGPVTAGRRRPTNSTRSRMRAPGIRNTRSHRDSPGDRPGCLRQCHLAQRLAAQSAGERHPRGLELSSRNAESWPAYLSLDLRTAWTRPLPQGVLDVFAEIDNVTNHGNPCCTYNYRLRSRRR